MQVIGIPNTRDQSDKDFNKFQNINAQKLAWPMHTECMQRFPDAADTFLPSAYGNHPPGCRKSF